MGNVSRGDGGRRGGGRFVGPSDLVDRVGRHGAPGRFWLYVEPGPGEGELTIETSWLPEEALATLTRWGAHIPAVTGSVRLPNGSIRCVIPAGDALLFERIERMALALLHREAFGE